VNLKGISSEKHVRDHSRFHCAFKLVIFVVRKPVYFHKYGADYRLSVIVRNLNGFVPVVGNENTCDTDFVDCISQPGSQLFANLCVNCGERLVKQKKLR
jgi:hypothetical protein